MGANCNQAIMIVTDGVPYKYEEIFKTYNFPHKNVRYEDLLCVGDRILDLLCEVAKLQLCSATSCFIATWS